MTSATPVVSIGAGLLALLLATPVVAQTGDGASIARVEPAAAPRDAATRDAAGVPTVHAFRLDAPLAVDGRLDEPIYGLVRPATDFVQQDPREGAPATERTEVWVFFDDRNLYGASRTRCGATTTCSRSTTTSPWRSTRSGIAGRR